MGRRAGYAGVERKEGAGEGMIVVDLIRERHSNEEQSMRGLGHPELELSTTTLPYHEYLDYSPRGLTSSARQAGSMGSEYERVEQTSR